MDVNTLNEAIAYLDSKPKCKVATHELRKLLTNEALTDFVNNRQSVIHRPDKVNAPSPVSMPYDLWFC